MIICELCVKQPFVKQSIKPSSKGEYYVHRFNIDYRSADIISDEKTYNKFIRSINKNVNEILKDVYPKNWLDYKVHVFDEECNHMACFVKTNPLLVN